MDSQKASLRREATLRERVVFRGHPMVRSLHPTTIEVTTEAHLTLRGDCIIGVSADKGCLHLREETKEALRREDAKVTLKILSGPESFSFKARGHPGLLLSDSHDIVVRKSGFLSERTLAVGAGAAAKDIPRSLVARLANPDAIGVLEIEVA